jgi:hypothetical protein
MSTQIKCYELSDSLSGSVNNEGEKGEVREVNRRFVIGRCEEGFNQVVLEMEDYAPRYVIADGAGIYWVRKRLQVNGIGNAYFDTTATYETLQPKPPQQNQQQNDFQPGSLAWDTTGHTEHITQSLKPETRIPAGETDFQGAINVSGDSVQGIDVVRPSLRYSETWILPAQVAVSCGFVGAVYRLTGTVNLNQFRCFAPGEALFMGARAQWQGDQPYVSATFDWEARPNGNVNLPYMPGVGELQMEKKGWEYVWVRYQPEADGGQLIRKPIAIYKDVVYEEKSWADLGMIAQPIGGPRPGATRKPPAAGGNGVA